MSSLGSLYFRFRSLADQTLLGGEEGPHHMYAGQFALPSQNGDYQQLPQWNTQHQHQLGQVPPPFGPPPAYGQQLPPQQQIYFPSAMLPTDCGQVSRSTPPSHPSYTNPTPPLHAQGTIDPMEPMIMTKTSVRAAHSGRLLFTMTRGSAPSSLSSRSLITVTRSTAGGPQVGSVRFHSLTSDDVDLVINGHATKLKEDGLMSTRWYFRSSPSSCSLLLPSTQKWWWSDGKGSDSLVLATEKKHGRVLARLQGDVLVFETSPHLYYPPAVVDEIVVTAVAMREITKRSEEETEMAAEVVSAVAGV